MGPEFFVLLQEFYLLSKLILVVFEQFIDRFVELGPPVQKEALGPLGGGRALILPKVLLQAQHLRPLSAEELFYRFELVVRDPVLTIRNLNHALQVYGGKSSTSALGRCFSLTGGRSHLHFFSSN